MKFQVSRDSCVLACSCTRGGEGGRLLYSWCNLIPPGANSPGRIVQNVSQSTHSGLDKYPRSQAAAVVVGL